MHPWQAKPCQLWPVKPGRKGNSYGQVVWRGHVEYVHRIAYALAHGLMVEDLAPGQDICHHCDTPACFEPSHLFAGTRVENMADMQAKGRTGDHRPRTIHYGEQHPQAKLTDEQVAGIRELGARGVRQRDLAERYGVTQTLIGLILRRKIWRHI